MKIKKLRLENFRIHKDSVLAPGDSPFVVVKGKNFAGKTTVGQGISLCLTPSTTGLDPKGAGFASKIKRGESKAVITAEIATKNYLIERTVTLNSSAAGRTQRSKCLSHPDWNTAPFDKKLESSKAALSVALNTDAFLRMDEKEQKNLLAGLALPSRYDFDPRIVEAVNRLLGEGGEGAVNFAGEPFAAINQAYKLLFNERQLVNREVRDFRIPEPLTTPAGVDLHSLQDRLTTLRMDRRRMQEERDAKVSEASKGEAERVRVKTKMQALEDKIRDEEDRAVTIRAFLAPDDRLAYLRKVAKGKEQLDALLKEKQETEKQIDDYLRQLGKLEELAEAGASCPTCDQPIDQKKLTAVSADLAVWLREAKNQNNVIFQKIRALGEVQQAVDELQKNADALNELAAIDQRVEEKSRQLADEKVPEASLFDFAPYNQTIEQIDAEIDRLTGQLHPAIAAEERRKEIASKREQLKVMEEKAGALDALVKYFDKDGIKTKLIGEYIGGFERRLNEVMSAWGYACALSIEPYQFDVTTARGDTVPVRELSGAERVMFSLAFQCAVSMTASIGLVVIDEVAMMLPEIRPILYRRLYEMVQQGHLEQVILLVADSSDQVRKLPGARFFMVDDGEVRPLSNGRDVPGPSGQRSEAGREVQVA